MGGGGQHVVCRRASFGVFSVFFKDDEAPTLFLYVRRQECVND